MGQIFVFTIWTWFLLFTFKTRFPQVNYHNNSSILSSRCFLGIVINFNNMPNPRPDLVQHIFMVQVHRKTREPDTHSSMTNIITNRVKPWIPWLNQQVGFQNCLGSFYHSLLKALIRIKIDKKKAITEIQNFRICQIPKDLEFCVQQAICKFKMAFLAENQK